MQNKCLTNITCMIRMTKYMLKRSCLPLNGVQLVKSNEACTVVKLYSSGRHTVYPNFMLHRACKHSSNCNCNIPSADVSEYHKKQFLESFLYKLVTFFLCAVGTSKNGNYSRQLNSQRTHQI